MMSHSRNGTSRATSSARWCRIRSRLAPDAKSLAVMLAIAAMFSLIACTYSPSTPTSPAPGTPTTGPTASAPTFGQLADSGKTVFNARCAKCHGDKGQGVTAPAIMGSGVQLGKYGTAQGMLSFISSSMPLDAPGSLPSDKYQQVLSYLLVQNNFVQGGTSFNSGNLSSIALK